MESENIRQMKYIVVALMLMARPVFGANILFIPANMNSHVLYFSRLAADLAQLGHVTRVLAPNNARVPRFIAEEGENGGNLKYTTYPVDGEESFANSRNTSANVMRLALSQSAWEKFTLSMSVFGDFLSHCESDCVNLLDNDHLMQQVRDDGYQFAVMDRTTHCYYAIPYSLGVPYATLSISGIAWSYRVPRLPSFAPVLSLGYTDRMSFVERLTTFVGATVVPLLLRNVSTTYVERLAPGRPPLNAHQLHQKACFVALSYARFRLSYGRRVRLSVRLSVAR